MRLSAEVFQTRIDELRRERDQLYRRLNAQLGYIEELERQLENAEPGLLKEVREYLDRV